MVLMFKNILLFKRLLDTSRLPRSLVGIFLLQLVTSAAIANTPPSFDRLENVRVAAGGVVEFSVRSVDVDGHVPGLFVDSAPAGSEFNDNGDGSRTFRWRPNESHIGQHRMLFVTVDALDASLRFSQSVFIDVVAAEQVPIAPVNSSAGNNSGNGVANTASEVTDSNQSGLQVVTGELVRVDGNYLPRIHLASTVVNAPADQALDVVVSASDNDGPIPALVVHSLPSGASFNDNRDGTRSIDWTPLPWQLGQFRIVIVAKDAVRDDHRVQTELTINITDAQVNSPQANNAVVQDTVQNAIQDVPAEQPATQPAASNNNDSSNRPPFFDGLTNQVVALGQTIQFVVAPRDPDGDVPGMFADRLPNRSSFKDNFDGTRTLTWRPFPVDEGDYWITIRITVENRGGFNFEPVINGINNPVIRAGDLLRQKVQPVDPDGEVPHLSVINPPEGGRLMYVMRLCEMITACLYPWFNRVPATARVNDYVFLLNGVVYWLAMPLCSSLFRWQMRTYISILPLKNSISYRRRIHISGDGYNRNADCSDLRTLMH